MAHVIKPKRSETGSAAPGTSDLETHEIAMNVARKNIYKSRKWLNSDHRPKRYIRGRCTSICNSIRIRLWHQHLKQ